MLIRCRVQHNTAYVEFRLFLIVLEKRIMRFNFVVGTP